MSRTTTPTSRLATTTAASATRRTRSAGCPTTTSSARPRRTRCWSEAKRGRSPLTSTYETEDPHMPVKGDRPLFASGIDAAHREVIFASSLGTVFEWYDFYLYGTLAVFFSALFFPPGNETA